MTGRGNILINTRPDIILNYILFSPKCQVEREQEDVMPGDVAEILNIRVDEKGQ